MLLFNLLSVSLVMLAAFAAIYLVTSRTIERENEVRLQAVSSMFSTPNRLPPENGLPGSGFGPLAETERFSVDYGVSFVLFVKDGQLENVNSQIDLEDSVYNEAFEAMGNSEKGQVNLAGRAWIFAVASPTSAAASASSASSAASASSGNTPSTAAPSAPSGNTPSAAAPSAPSNNTPSDNAPSGNAPSGTQSPPTGVNPMDRQSDDGPYTRIVFLDITNNKRLMQTLLITLICVAVAVLLALFWLSHRFASQAIRPIEKSYDQQRRFTADASHELRTPLAIIGADVDAIEASDDETADSQRTWLNSIRAELAHTGKLVDDLLTLAKTESTDAENGSASTAFDLSLLCETVCLSLEARLYDNEVSLEADIDRNVWITADHDRIRQVLAILMDNAGKYTPQGGSIVLSLKRNKSQAVLKVANNGAGIDPLDLERIFDRFYRTDTSRSSETGGFGLGLSIAKAIVERLGGSISAASVDGLTTFTVCLRLS
jgi:signal transduction histidine kinase